MKNNSSLQPHQIEMLTRFLALYFLLHIVFFYSIWSVVLITAKNVEESQQQHSCSTMNQMVTRILSCKRCAFQSCPPVLLRSNNLENKKRPLHNGHLLVAFYFCQRNLYVSKCIESKQICLNYRQSGYILLKSRQIWVCIQLIFEAFFKAGPPLTNAMVLFETTNYSRRRRISFALRPLGLLPTTRQYVFYLLLW